jgi:hypothetical protein
MKPKLQMIFGRNVTDRNITSPCNHKIYVDKLKIPQNIFFLLFFIFTCLNDEQGHHNQSEKTKKKFLFYKSFLRRWPL